MKGKEAGLVYKDDSATKTTRKRSINRKGKKKS